ncbi:MAG TPA: TolC family protein [Isosphaeraceae bacterium]|nr:TolC family protein [Isosphaeraceae bacterium]
MRLTLGRNRWIPAALLAAWVLCAGCQRLPYIDQSKPVPHDNMGRVALEDAEVKQASLLSSKLPMQLPKVAKPRTTNDPEAQEVWPMTLQEAIRIGLDNSEVVRVIAFGAQGIPIGGFEPTPLNTGAGAGIASSLGSGTLQTVYDPAILETQIATALSTFDTAFTTSILWGDAVQPFNNGIQGGSLTLSGTRYPIVSVNDSYTFQAGLSKRTETGAQLGIVHNINWSYQNSSFLVWPSAFTTNLQLTLTQPLLGSAPLPGQNAGPPVGLEANRAPIVIARLNADAAVWRFKAEVMAEVRSIEQQYWNLAQAHVQLWSADRAVELAREILVREEAELAVGRGTFADVAEASQRLEQFTLDWVTRTSDVITTERQLRNLLGLPPADNRRIIPITPPTEARLEPDWDSSLAQMLSFQPDIVQQQILVRVAELQLLLARNQLLPQLSLNALYQFNGLGQRFDTAEAVMTGATLKALNPVIAARETAAGLNANPGNYNNFITWQVGFTFQMPLGMRSPLANTRQAQYVLLRARAYLQQVVHQTTHSLARFFLEIDANYKQFKTASRLRAAAAQRLDAQRSYYEEGRITIDRFLDAVSQYATAVATEAQYKTTYNISIVALEEAKGTLLAYDNIAVAEGPWPRKAYIQARDIQDAHRQHHIPPDGPMMPYRPLAPANPDDTTPKPPPNAEEPENMPAMPAPVGPLGPAPTPIPPHVPSSTQPFLSQATPGAGTVRPVANSGPAAAGTGPAQGPAPADVTLTGGESARSWAGPTTSASPLSRSFLPSAAPPTRPPISTHPAGTAAGAAAAPPQPPAAPAPGPSPIPGAPPAAPAPPPQSPVPTPSPAPAGPSPAEEFPPLPVSIDLPPLPPK